MSTEIDSLEIQVEAEARNANRALSSMEKHLDKIADSLMKVSALTNGVGEIGNFDFGGLKKFKTEMDSVFQTQKKIQKSSSPRINRSDLKYTAKSLDEIYDKFKRVGTSLDVSKMGLPELKAGLRKAESEAERLNQRLEKKISIEGTSKLGKSYENLVYDIQRATNQAEIFKNKISEVNKKANKITITRGKSESTGTYEKKPAYISPDSFNYDPTAMRMTFGEGIEDLKNFNDVMSRFGGNARTAAQSLNQFNESANSNKINTYEAQIKKLKSELVELSLTGLSQGDENYDKKASELARVIAMQKKYNKEMKEAAEKSVEFDKTSKSINEVGNSLKKAKKEASLLSKAISSINKVKKGLSNAKKAFGFESSGNKGMSFGRMLGSSVLFSFVFQGISAIQNAIKEGSDNLVQYSSVYNRSISSIVSALTYLKNAWAAAFSPIMNVVAPYLESFINMIAGALNMVGQFMAALTGKGFAVQAKKVWTDYGAGLKDVGSGGSDAAKGLNDAAKAAKDLQSYTLGIDELNVIQPTKNSGSGSSGSGGGSTGGSGSGVGVVSPSDMFETVEVSSSIKSLADKFKEAIKTGDFTEIGRMISNKLSESMESINWNSVYKKAEKFGKGFATFLNGLITPRLFYNLGRTIANSINTAFSAANAFAINFDWKNLGKSIAKSIKGFFENWDAKLTGETLGNFAKGILESLTSTINELGSDDTFEDIGQKLVDFICGVDWLSLTFDLADFFVALEEALADFPSDFARGVGQSIIDKIFGEDSGITFPDISIPQPTLDILGNQFGAIKFLSSDTASSIAKNFSNGWSEAKKSWSGGESFFSGIFKGIKVIFSPISEWFKEKFDSAAKFTKIAFQFIGSWFGDRYKEITNKFISVKDYFYEKFNSAYSSVKNVFKNIGSWFGDRWNDIKNIFGSGKIEKFFKDGFGDAYNAIKNIWDGAGDYFKKIANNIISPIGKAVNGVISGINWVLDKVGSKKRLAKWDVPKFSSGTGGLSRDTLGLVNDQKGSTYKELIVPPHGNPFVPEGRNVMLPLEKGTKIMPARKTKKLISNVPKFKDGIGDFTGNIFDYLTKPSKILNIAIDKFTDKGGWSGIYGEIAKGAVNTIFDGALSYIKKLFESTGGVGLEKAVNWAIGIANNNTHGYDQAHRTGPDYDCSSLVTSALKAAGFKIGIGTTSTMYGMLKSAGFKNVTSSVNRGNASGMRKGDVLLTPGKHTAMYIGGGKIVHASINELGRVTGGKTGDQTGKEICTRGYYNYPWTYVLRYGKFKNGVGRISASDLIPIMANGGFVSSGQMFIARERGPELVGSVGNRSAVMNNNQIVDSVSRGVEASFDNGVALLLNKLNEVVEYQQRLLNKDTSVNLDGKRVDKGISRARNNRGYSFSST